MNQKKYLWVLYIIIVIIMMTIAMQGYWNYNNYQTNKQQFKNEVQISLDNAIEGYYAEIAKINQGFKKDILSNIYQKKSADEKKTFSSKILKEEDNQQYENGAINISIIDRPARVGSTKREVTISSSEYKETYINADSIKLLNGISAIYVSIVKDSLDFARFNSFLEKELVRKNLAISYALKHYKNDTIIDVFNEMKKNHFKTVAKSAYLKKNERIELLFYNEAQLILKQGLIGVLLSLLFSLAIISSLFYLLYIINKQKELAEIKNDLISNITHEFKTPITTISTAIEAIQNFNTTGNKKKTKDYLTISTFQLKKLDLMVEKLLETSTLGGGNLILKKEIIDIVDLIKRYVEKQKLFNQEKIITFSSNVKELYINIDAFHFENVIVNFFENAVKYGGDTIEVIVNLKSNILEINVMDNGVGIDKKYKDLVFDKFYRIPKGNKHDVKGFGIGLYYSKQIIKKHKGIIELVSTPKKTIFKIIIEV